MVGTERARGGCSGAAGWAAAAPGHGREGTPHVHPRVPLPPRLPPLPPLPGASLRPPPPSEHSICDAEDLPRAMRLGAET
eukprot:560412-Rhodomonas_salina.2